MKQLHILNGQGTAYNFQLPGDYLVWNEALACGNTHYEVATGDFYQVRCDFMRTRYNDLPLREPQPFSDEKYQEIVIQEMEKLKDIQNYDNVILWFEFDWFCQVNLMAALSWFWQHQALLDTVTVSLVCINEHPAIDDFRGLGQLSPEHFAPLFDQKQQLNLEDIEFADKVWAAYCGQDMLLLSDLIHTAQSQAFPFLAQAFAYFQQLFPNQQTGLNIIEQQMLDILQEKPLENRHQWVGQILRQINPYLGFGDLQYYDTMQRMELLWEETNQVQLTEMGKKVANHQQNFLNIQPEQYALGGVLNTAYRWQTTQQKLVKI